jgi:ABC-2 type transport system permease protein
MLAQYLLTEALKLRRSLVLLLAFAAPLFVVVVCVLIGLRSHDAAVPMDKYGLTGAAFWAFAMLPMSVTALSVLMSQMEHGARSWDHMLILPGARPRLFLAKALVLFGIVAAMTAWLWLVLRGGAWLVGEIKPLDGQFQSARIAKTLALMLAASGMMIALQLWLALRSRSFVPPLVLGIVGTFVAVAAASAKEGAYFPWLMPLHTLSTDPVLAERALWFGSLGGLAVLAGMVVDLNRRELV